MPIKKFAVKKVKQDKKKRSLNRARKNAFRVKIKEVKKHIEDKKFDKAKEVVVEVISALDKAAKKNTIHKNTASRKKSRLVKLLKRTSGKDVILKPRKRKETKSASKSKANSKKTKKKS